MSFQAYIDNIKAKTGKSPEDFRRAAQKQGLLDDSYQAMALVGWLKSEFGLAACGETPSGCAKGHSWLPLSEMRSPGRKT